MDLVSRILSIIALVVAIGSLGVSAYVAFRDRARLKLISKFYEASEWGPSKIRVTVINQGRRVAILRLIGGSDSQGDWGGYFVEHEKGGRRLAEHERYEFDITKEDTVDFNRDGPELVYETLWVEDSLEVRHSVPNSRELIKKLWA